MTFKEGIKKFEEILEFLELNIQKIKIVFTTVKEEFFTKRLEE